MSSELLPILAQEIYQKILAFLAGKGRASFLEIQDQIPVNSKELRKDLKKLEDNDLVIAVTSSDPDFNTYLLTAEGYRVHRGLNRMLEAA